MWRDWKCDQQSVSAKSFNNSLVAVIILSSWREDSKWFSHTFVTIAFAFGREESQSQVTHTVRQEFEEREWERGQIFRALEYEVDRCFLRQILELTFLKEQKAWVQDCEWHLLHQQINVPFSNMPMSFFERVLRWKVEWNWCFMRRSAVVPYSLPRIHVVRVTETLFPPQQLVNKRKLLSLFAWYNLSVFYWLVIIAGMGGGGGGEEVAWFNNVLRGQVQLSHFSRSVHHE